jgi:hypothetical protein
MADRGRWRSTASTARRAEAGRQRWFGGRLLARTEYRFGLVLLLLLVTFVVLMIGSSSQWVRPVTVALAGTTLIAALFAADVSMRMRRVAAVVTAVAFVTALSTLGLNRSGDGTAAVLCAGLVALAPVVIARSVVRRRVIDVQTVLAALTIYVLLGMLWAFVYGILGGFGTLPFFAEQVAPTSADYLYFSFITQTTVGYGDLSAATNPGRACAVLEALIGQLYLVTVVAVVVSRLTPRVRGTAGSAPGDESGTQESATTPDAGTPRA